MKTVTALFVALFAILAINCVTANVFDSDEARIRELAAEIAKDKQDIRTKEDEMLRIKRTSPNRHLVIPSTVSPSQSPSPPESRFDQVLSAFKVRQTLKDPNLADLPAKLSYVSPDSGSSTIAVDAGIDLDLLPALNAEELLRETTAFDMFVEYHNNNSSMPPVDTLLAGVQFRRNLTSAADQLSDNSREWHNWIAGDASFKRDAVVSGEGFLGELYYYPHYKPLGIGTYQSFRGLPVVEYLITPTIGIQCETGNGASKKFTDGDRISIRGGLTLTVDPFPIELDHRVEWSNSITDWSHLSTSGGLDQYERNQYFLIAR